MKNALLIPVLLLLPFMLTAQFATTQINQFDRMWYENQLLISDHKVHTAILPWRTDEVAPFDGRQVFLPDSSMSNQEMSWLRRKLTNEHLFAFRGEGYEVNIDPVIGMVLGNDSEAIDYNTIYQNSRGLRVEGELGDRFSFYTTVVESQARFPAHVNHQAQRSRVVPGYWRRKNFRDEASDFAYAAGEIAYTSKKFFHFRMGRGKQFIGEGYRSMLISDNSTNYPFFRIETTIGRLKYVNLWSIMNDIREEVQLADEVFARKYLSMHYLSIDIGNRLNIGLFEGIMWGDSLNRYGFDANFFNPVILYRPVEFSVGAQGGNTLIGLTGSYRIGKGMKLYGQLAIDEFVFSEIRKWNDGPWVNMLAGQIGIKWGNALGIENLFLRAEYNGARPYTYSHRDVITNWGHYTQPLAHPLGANFREMLLQAHYRKDRWTATGAIHTALQGLDESRAENWGGDIYKSYDLRPEDDGIFIGNGNESQLLYWRAEITYLANPLYNLRLELGVQKRSEDNSSIGLPNSQSVYFGLKTNMYELYQSF